MKSWIVRTRENKKIDIVLGYHDDELYQTNPLYLGSTVGRYANRIANGIFQLNGKDIRLNQNDGMNHLHGGKKRSKYKIMEFFKDFER